MNVIGRCSTQCLHVHEHLNFTNVVPFKFLALVDEDLFVGQVVPNNDGLLFIIEKWILHVLVFASKLWGLWKFGFSSVGCTYNQIFHVYLTHQTFRIVGSQIEI